MQDDPFPHLQDVMSTLPLLSKSYVRFLIAFSTSSPPPTIEHALRVALTQLTDAFPYLAGQVVIGSEDQKPRIVAYQDTIELVVKNVRDDVPSMDELRKAKFPFSMLDGRLLAPDIAHSRKVGPDEVAPVLTLQASFVKGGVLLGLYGNHCQMDMAGMAVIIRLLAKTLNGEPFTETELAQVNQARTDAIPLLDDSITDEMLAPELDDVLAKPHSFTTQGAALPPSRWVYLNFSDTSLKRLKDDAARTKTPDIPFLTTDDALCAFLWQRINRARQNTQPSVFGRVASLRRLFGLGNYYVGNMCDIVYIRHDDEAEPIWETPLGVVASRLRRRLLPDRDAENRRHMQVLATALHRARGADRDRLIFGANLDFGRDLYVSSVTKVAPVCEWSFGPVLGVPEAGRRPNLPDNTLLGFVVSMPRARGEAGEEGDLAVAACLSDDDIDMLKRDELVAEYAAFLDR